MSKLFNSPVPLLSANGAITDNINKLTSPLSYYNNSVNNSSNLSSPHYIDNNLSLKNNIENIRNIFKKSNQSTAVDVEGSLEKVSNLSLTEMVQTIYQYIYNVYGFKSEENMQTQKKHQLLLKQSDTIHERYENEEPNNRFDKDEIYGHNYSDKDKTLSHLQFYLQEKDLHALFRELRVDKQLPPSFIRIVLKRLTNKGNNNKSFALNFSKSGSTIITYTLLLSMLEQYPTLAMVLYSRVCDELRKASLLSELQAAKLQLQKAEASHSLHDADAAQVTTLIKELKETAEALRNKWQTQLQTEKKLEIALAQASEALQKQQCRHQQRMTELASYRRLHSDVSSLISEASTETEEARRQRAANEADIQLAQARVSELQAALAEAQSELDRLLLYHQQCTEIDVKNCDNNMAKAEQAYNNTVVELERRQAAVSESQTLLQQVQETNTATKAMLEETKQQTQDLAEQLQQLQQQSEEINKHLAEQKTNVTVDESNIKRHLSKLNEINATINEFDRRRQKADMDEDVLLSQSIQIIEQKKQLEASSKSLITETELLLDYNSSIYD